MNEEAPKSITAREIWRRRKGETAKAYAAFTKYLAMPVESRSLQKLSQMMGHTSRRHVSGWSGIYEWQKRCRAWDTAQSDLDLKAMTEERRKLARERAQAALTVQARAVKVIIGDEKDQYGKPGIVKGLHTIAITSGQGCSNGGQVSAWKELDRLADIFAVLPERDEASGDAFDGYLGAFKHIIEGGNLSEEEKSQLLTLLEKGAGVTQ